MLLRRPGTAGADADARAGSGTGSGIGALLDTHLPWPRQRAAFRSWRRRRPFWAGVLLGLAGLDVLMAPLSPLSVLVHLGAGGLAAIGIGAALVLAGAFLILAPHTRTYVSLNALLLSVVSFVATNLGGFVVGTLLGITGSAMGFGWTPRPVTPTAGTDRTERTDRTDHADRTDGMEDADGADGTDGTDGAAGPSGVDGATGASGSGDARKPSGRALTLVVPLGLTLALVGGGAPRAQAATTQPAEPTQTAGTAPTTITAPTASATARGTAATGTAATGSAATTATAAAQDGAPGRVALAPAVVSASRFSPQGFTFAGTREMTTAEGRFEVIVLRMKAATLTDYRLESRDPGSAQQELTSNSITMTGHVTLYMKSFSGCIQGIPGLTCVTFAPDQLPAPPVVPPFVFMTKVRGEQALITSDSLVVDGLAIHMTTRSDAGSGADNTRPAPEPTKGADGNAPPDGTTPPDGGSGGETPAPGSGGGSGLDVGVARREPADVPWCEKVTLTFTATGGTPVTSGTVDFTTHIVGALGVPWVTQTSHRELPVPLEPGDRTTRSWRICVNDKYAGMFLFDRHLEHDVTVHHPGGDPVRVEVPYP